MQPTWKQRLTLAFFKLLNRFVEPDLLVHDSWSAPRTPEERELLRQRLEQLQNMQPRPMPTKPGAKEN